MTQQNRLQAMAALALLMWAPVWVGARDMPPPLTAENARRAVAASLDMRPGDDIQYNFRPMEVQIADIDGKGTQGIVYVYTSTYTGGTFEQANELVVMTRMRPDDPRGQGSPSGNHPLDEADLAILREVGFADDASTHIPGVFKQLQVVDGQLGITFESRTGSTYCHEEHRRKAGVQACPEPGKHTWQWRWSPGALKRIEPR